MIRYVQGNLFDSKADVLVNPVNTVGVMGTGLAMAFKLRYPKMFSRYAKHCRSGLFEIGKLMLVQEEDHKILLFPTKTDWKMPSDLSYIEAGLKKFREAYAAKGIKSVAFPRLGCGHGQLRWSDVKPLMEKYLGDLPVDIEVRSVVAEENA